MPVIFGLEFGAAKSRYGVTALALRDACAAHHIKMVVPRCYLNEMAAHGREVLDILNVHHHLPEEARKSLKASGNAYLSHYTHISETMKGSGEPLTLDYFVRHFGIVAGHALNRIENRIELILDKHNIRCIEDCRYDQYIKNRIVDERPCDPRILIDHDAIVCTMIKNSINRGFILATWDNVLVGVVEDIARVFADTPARVVDFLSMAVGQSFECEQSFELLSTLLHADEKIAQRLAEKVEKIRSVEQAHKLDAYIASARQRGDNNWTLRPEDVAPFLDDDPQLTVVKDTDDA